MDETLKLPLLGSRNYLHGTTLFEALEKRFVDGSAISLKLSQMMLTDTVRVQEFDPAVELGRAYSATVTWMADGSRRGLGVSPLLTSDQIDRAVYDEESIVAKADFQDHSVTIAQPSGYSLVKTIVALHKALLFRLLAPARSGQWLFTRFDLEAVPASWLPLSISHGQGSNLAAVASEVAFDGRPGGRVMFSWWDR